MFRPRPLEDSLRYDAGVGEGPAATLLKTMILYQVRYKIPVVAATSETVRMASLESHIDRVLADGHEKVITKQC